jgi:dihydroorotate dehydrogenase electron transfer subunit
MAQKKIKKVVEAKVVANDPVGGDMFLLNLDSDWLGANSVPGQFVNIKVQENVMDPLLRIPIGISSIRKKGISVLYKVVGEGTKVLSRRKKGETINVLGPLGNGFDLTGIQKSTKGKAILISGGYGLGPIMAVRDQLGSRQALFIGMKTKKAIPGKVKLKKKGIRTTIATDDGTTGKKGVVTAFVEQYIERNKGKKNNMIIFSCGPEPMVKTVAGIAGKYGIEAQVTRDEYMACGIGVCKGCAVETIQGIKFSCTDGPVFKAEELKW